MAAIAGMEVDGVTSTAATTSETASANGSWVHGKADTIADEPVTMAVAAGAESRGAASRWTAVSVALAPEEGAISLEQEMQKAYAAFAAAETGHSTVVMAPQPTQAVSAEPALAAAESLVAVPATPAPEAAQALSAMANAATDAITAAVKELEAVAASYLEHKSTAPAQAEPASAERLEAAPDLGPEAPQKSDPAVENNGAASAQPASEAPKFETMSEAAKPEEPRTWREEQKNEELKKEASGSDVAVPFVTVATPTSEEAPKTAESAAELTATAFVDAVPAGQSATEQVAVQPSASQFSPEASAVVTADAAAPVVRDALNQESEIAANTAAAWASWRRIRESPVPESQPAESSAQESEEIASGPQDAAAMAVAAGAEKSPEESSAASDDARESDTDGIANIVDSVLAEMRPKIYEEISRKMKKK